MELRYLDTFLVLADNKTFTEAADKLYISQPSLTKRIQKMEYNLGVVLFERNTRNVQLNYYGQIYLAYAIKIRDLESACDQKMKEITTTQNGITVGAIPSINEYHISDLLTAFMKTTGITCALKTATSGKLELMLKEHQCDFAFIKEVSGDESLKVLPYFKDILVAVLPKQHPLTNRKSIEISELVKEKFLLEPINSRPYNLCVKLCKKAVFTPNITYTDSHIENITSLVEKGMGISLLMRQLTADSPIVAVPIRPHIQAHIDLCYDASEALNNEKVAFLNYFSKNKYQFNDKTV
ncbi:LysR family transcriptional regulator [Lacticaseibacillus zeae]|uniref:LysR family transcriptional regulator n=1 Tax=Lacticaseibacillus zeae TaxID=57037 RepID=A0A5R8LNQ4_LACZE|nr:LysR family transcriptional regulator [Lacticaseibacillus zeae]TLF38848.1 LysR family transcriptional regulator [Lacticaseibacillus zeae]